MRYVGGSLQAEFMARVRGVDPRACLVVPVDVGKVEAMALVADHHGEVVVAPFRFALTDAVMSSSRPPCRSPAASATRRSVGSVWNRPVTITRRSSLDCARPASRWSS